MCDVNGAPSTETKHLLCHNSVSFFTVRAENNPVAKISIRAIIIMTNLLAIVCFHFPMGKKESS